MIDFITKIVCPDCSEMVYNRFDCDCKEKEQFCGDPKHHYFYCTKCEDKKDVSFKDEPKEVIDWGSYVPRSQREENPEALAKERVALEKIFSTLSF